MRASSRSDRADPLPWRRRRRSYTTPSSMRERSPKSRWRSPARSVSTRMATSWWKSCSGYLSSGNDTNLGWVAHAAPDRRGARQTRDRPERGQACGGHRAAQPDAPAETDAGARRRDRAEEHLDDRPDRRRQDRNRAPARAARAVALSEG